MALVRTTKELAERIDLNYFKRSHPVRTWMRGLIVGAAVIAGAWVVIDAIRGDRGAYAPGPLGARHAMFSRQCAQCHAPANNEIYWRGVSDEACTKCHPGPRHRSNQSFTPSCASCHLEHKGRTQLISVSDQHCLQCHSDLETGGPSIHKPGCLVEDHRTKRQIESFDDNHPEFAVFVQQYKDAAQIKLNHQVHLKPGLKGVDQLHDQPTVIRKDGGLALTCSFCHQPDSRRAYMVPIQYEKHCLACHSLKFDSRFPEAVPHEKMESVISFAQEKYSEYILTHPRAIERGRIQPIRRLPGQPRFQQLPASARAWVDRQVENAKKLLFRKTCAECHRLESQSRSHPTIVPPTIPARWLVHSSFRHAAHRALTCTACHQRAKTSQQTADILLPNIMSCRQCHKQSAAGTSCITCHLYHDKSQTRGLDGRLFIPQLLSETPQK